MFCGECGTEIPEGASFCSNCGEPVAGGKSAGLAQRSRKKSAVFKFLFCVIGGLAASFAIAFLITGVIVKRSEQDEWSDLCGTWKWKTWSISGLASISEAAVSGPGYLKISDKTLRLLTEDREEMVSIPLSDVKYYPDEDGVEAYHFSAEWYVKSVEPGVRQYQLRFYYQEEEDIICLDVYDEGGWVTHDIMGFDDDLLEEPYEIPEGYHTIRQYTLQK